MRVLQLGKFYPAKGGVEKVMFDIAFGLADRGIQCDVLCARAKGSRIEAIATHSYCNMYVEDTLVSVLGTTISPAMVRRLRHIKGVYDLIHIHHPDPMAAYALCRSGYRGRVVLHWHSDILRQKFALKLYGPLQKWLVNRADLILGTTPVYVQNSPFLRHVQDRVAYVPIGIDASALNEHVTTEIKNKYSGKKIVLSIGRLVPYKGYEYLVEAAKYLSDEYVILIGGTGPERGRLEALIEQYDLEEKVKLLGFIPVEDKSSYYEASSVFVLSSKMKTEAFAIVQIEAMSFGKPVVATEIEGSGVPWINRNGYSGLNVPICNAEAIATAITAICEGGAYETFSQQARERYLSLFTKEQMIDKTISYYESLING